MGNVKPVVESVDNKLTIAYNKYKIKNAQVSYARTTY